MNKPRPAPWLANPPSQIAKIRIGSLKNSDGLVKQNVPEPRSHYRCDNNIDRERVNFLSRPYHLVYR